MLWGQNRAALTPPGTKPHQEVLIQTDKTQLRRSQQQMNPRQKDQGLYPNLHSRAQKPTQPAGALGVLGPVWEQLGAIPRACSVPSHSAPHQHQGSGSFTHSKTPQMHSSPPQAEDES